MRAHIVVITDDGKKYEADIDLVAAGNAPKPSHNKKNQLTAASHQSMHVDFSLNIRNFVNTHASSMSGPQRFALLVAYAARGKADQEVDLAQIAKQWSKMTAHLGKFNPAYTTRAKDEGWVDSPKQGQYKLLPKWTEILGAN
jgi:hypothetical protein